jgi:SsrA-binding protein
MAKEKEQHKRNTPRVVNRKARHEYHVLETLECGLDLTGTEVKSIRAGQAKIDEAYARIDRGELWLIGMNIAPYQQAAPAMQHEPNRDRKLLVHKRQLAALMDHVRQKGKTIIPLTLYFQRGWAKLEIGVAIGKKQFDKRQDLKKRQAQRDMDRAMGKRSRRD